MEFYLDIADDLPLSVDEPVPLVPVVDAGAEGDGVLEHAAAVGQAKLEVVAAQADRLARGAPRTVITRFRH